MLLPWRDSSPNGLRGQGPIDPASDLPYLSPNHMGIRTCPRCSQPLHQGHSACPVCDFSLADVDSTFGSKRVRLQRIVDASSTISDVKAEWLNEKMDRFELDFPQLLFVAYIADLSEDLNLRELGFWLINRGIIDSPRSNDSVILLCINSRIRSASLSLGYVPEQHLTEEALSAILKETRAHLAQCHFAQVIASCLDSLTLHLQHPAPAG